MRLLSNPARVLGAAAMTAMLAVVPATADETIEADGGNIAITPMHHASLAISLNDTNILIDPAPQGDNAQATIDAIGAMPAPQVILLTHAHGDHFNLDVLSAVTGDATIVAPAVVADQLPETLKAKARVLANGETAEVAGVTIEAVPMYNTTEGRLQYHEKGVGNGYVLTIGGKRIYIAGDTEDIPEMRALTAIDAAFIPMNLPYTMTVEQAADAVKAFKPGIVYPYHYGESDVNQFKSLVGDASDVRLLDWYPAS